MWLNHAAIAAPRNGTNSHSVNPNTAAAVGTPFTPTAGNLLVVMAEGPVTSTTPPGWTLGSSAVNNTGLYVWYRTAAGADTLTTTHNGSNFPVMFDWYEFAAGTSWVNAVSQISVASGAVGPVLSGLTGTTFVGYVLGQGQSSTVVHSSTWSVGAEAVDYSELKSGTDGYTYGLAYSDGFTGTSASSAATLSSPTPATERLVWAVTATAGTGVTGLLTGTATLTGQASKHGTVTATLTDAAILTGAAGQVAPIGTTTGQLTAAATLAGAAVKHATAGAELDWTATLTGTAAQGTQAQSTTGQLAGVVTLTGLTVKHSVDTGHVAATAVLTGTAAQPSTTTGLLTGTATLTGLTVKHGAGTGALAVMATLTGVSAKPTSIPSRDLKILATGSPTISWATTLILPTLQTGPLQQHPLTTTSPLSGWSTTTPSN